MLGDYALKVNEKDNVAIVFKQETANNEIIKIKDHLGNETVVTAQNCIPFGHKIALGTIAKNAEIIKYGEVIGIATCNIMRGEHVHIHNMDSQRGRGDWHREESEG